jgi:TRAP-type C4-dicarboxylate transport system substrate-binding protein
MMKPFTGEHAAKEGWAFGGALTEYMFNDCPDCLAEFDAQNQVPTAFVAGTWSGLICTTPIKSLDDLDGARIRTGSANHARWAEAVGATPIQMSANEMREALDTGVADCAVLDLSNIPAYGVEESISDITTAVPGGLFPSSPFQFNQDTWSSFSTEEREAMLKSAATGAAAILTQYREDMLTTRALMKDLGANFHEADGDVSAASEAFAKDDLKAAARSYAEKYDIQNGEQKLEDFRELLDKWRELVKDVETSEALADLLWSEVLSDVDAATYGVK